MEENLETMDFLFEIKLRQETALKCNPIKQTNKFERMYIRMKLKRLFLIADNELKKSDVQLKVCSLKLFIALLDNHTVN
jgi:hypothetical protein